MLLLENDGQMASSKKPPAAPSSTVTFASCMGEGGVCLHRELGPLHLPLQLGKLRSQLRFQFKPPCHAAVQDAHQAPRPFVFAVILNSKTLGSQGELYYEIQMGKNSLGLVFLLSRFQNKLANR